MALIKGYECQVYVSDDTGGSYPLNGLKMVDSGDHHVFNLTNNAWGCWDPYKSIKVYEDNVLVADGYLVNWVAGAINFTDEHFGNVTVSCYAFEPGNIRDMIESFEIEVNPVLDEYTYLNCRAPAIAWIFNGGKATINLLHENPYWFQLADKLVIIQICEFIKGDPITQKATCGSWLFYGRVGDKITIDPSKLVRGAIDITVTEGISYKIL